MKQGNFKILLQVFIFVIVLIADARIKATGQQIFRLTEPDKFSLFLVSKNGDVEVMGWDSSIIAVEFTKIASSKEGLQKTLIYFHETDDSLGIRVKGPTGDGGRLFSWLFSEEERASVNFKIRMPKNLLKIKLVSENGSIRLSKTNAVLQALTTNGKIILEEIGGQTECETTNGGITISSFHGDIHAETVNGSIHLAIVSGLTGAIRTETVNGGISLQLPAETNADLDLQTVNGGIHTREQILVSGTLDKNELKGRLGKGGISVKAETVNGGIRLNQEDE